MNVPLTMTPDSPLTAAPVHRPGGGAPRHARVDRPTHSPLDRTTHHLRTCAQTFLAARTAPTARRTRTVEVPQGLPSDQPSAPPAHPANSLVTGSSDPSAAATYRRIGGAS